MTRKHFVLSQRLSRDLRRKIFRIDDAHNKVQPLGDQLVTTIHDENATHIQHDVVTFLLRLKRIKKSSTGHKQQCTKLELAIPIVRQRFVQRCVLLVRHILWFSRPEGCAVHLGSIAHLACGTTVPHCARDYSSRIVNSPHSLVQDELLLEEWHSEICPKWPYSRPNHP